MVEQATSPQPARKGWKVRILIAAAALLLLATGGVFVWFMNGRIHDLQARLTGMERRAASAEQEALQNARELNSTQSRLITAQERALQAEHRAGELQIANQQSSSQLDQFRQESQAKLEQLREQSQSAAAAAEQASKEKAQALTELQGIRARRAAELDRMQHALNQIAPTTRTATGMVMQLANKSFRFNFDSASLRPENRETLSRVAGVLLASEGYRLFIDGHTDDIGTDDYNQGLSERRAQSVRDYLVKAGVPADIITVNGFGKTNPLVKGKTREAREKNRRVEIGIVDTIIKYDTAGRFDSAVASKTP